MLLSMTLLLASLTSASVAADSTHLACSCVEADSTQHPVAPIDTIRPRRHAIVYSEWYARRLEVHRIGSYTMLPLFAGEYVLGQKLINGADRHSAIGSAHQLVAGGLGVLFTVNTITGAWNLWDSRSDPAGRTRRTIHVVSMLVGDAGFVWTGAIAGQAKRSNDAARRHRAVALGSIGISTLGTAMMWIWKN